MPLYHQNSYIEQNNMVVIVNVWSYFVQRFGAIHEFNKIIYCTHREKYDFRTRVGT